MKAKRSEVIGKQVWIAPLNRALTALEYYEDTCTVVVSPRYQGIDDRQGFVLGVDASIIDEPAPAPTTHPHRQTVIDRAAARGILKITDADVEASETLRAVAINFVETYKGFNSFVQDLAVALDKWGRLSVAQMRGALNVMLAEARQAQAPKPAPFVVNLADVPAPRFPDVSEHTRAQEIADAKAYAATTGDSTVIADVLNNITPVVPNGTYTVPINDHGEYRVIRLSDCPESYNKPAGTQIAAYQSGASNESDFTGFAFVTGDTFTHWRKFHNARDLRFALVKLITTGRHAEFGKLWAMESKRCFICGRKLTVPISKLAGIGPVCAANTGIDIDALAALNSAEVTRKERAKAQADIDELFPD